VNTSQYEDFSSCWDMEISSWQIVVSTYRIFSHLLLFIPSSNNGNKCNSSNNGSKNNRGQLTDIALPPYITLNVL